MLAGNRCENCSKEVLASKARFKQTKWCDRCAKLKKRASSLASRPPRDRRDYMRTYMAAYRLKNPGLSTPYVQKHRATRKLKGARAA